MQARYDQHIFLDELAREAAVNGEYLRLAFKAVFGISIFKHLRKIRLRKACELLRETSLDIEAIAARVNFSYASNLTHAFRQEYGVPPGVWRRENSITQDQ